MPNTPDQIENQKFIWRTEENLRKSNALIDRIHEKERLNKELIENSYRLLDDATKER